MLVGRFHFLRDPTCATLPVHLAYVALTRTLCVVAPRVFTRALALLPFVSARACTRFLVADRARALAGVRGADPTFARTRGFFAAPARLWPTLAGVRGAPFLMAPWTC